MSNRCRDCDGGDGEGDEPCTCGGLRTAKLEADLVAARAQLPDGMKTCTIIATQCPVGHSNLTATHWLDVGCPWCWLAELRTERDKLAEENRLFHLIAADDKDTAEHFAEMEYKLVAVNKERDELRAAATVSAYRAVACAHGRPRGAMCPHCTTVTR